MSKPAAKPRAICRDRTVRFPHAQPGLGTGRLQSRLKVPCEKLAPLKIAARIRPTIVLHSGQRMRQTLVEGRSNAANTRVARRWYRIQAFRLTSL